MIIYSTNDPAPFQFGTEAQHVCDTGFGIESGSAVRVCLGNATNTIGEWGGVAPVCSGE